MSASRKSERLELPEAAGELLRSPHVAPAVAGRRLLVLVNPIAGRGRKRYLQKVLAALRAEGAQVSVYTTEAAGQAWRMAASTAATRADVIVAAGGDGTVNEVVNGLAANSVPPALGVIPLGAANVFARNLRLPHRPAALARCLAEARALPFLPGSVNGRLFVAMAGIGFDARVVAGVSTGLKRHVGKGAYVWQSLRELARNRSRLYVVRCGGEERSAAGVVAARGRHYGGGFVMAPEARLARPAFELCCVAGGGALDIARQAIALGLGRFHRLVDLEQRQCTAAEVDGPADEPIQADGDLVGYLPARIAMAGRPIQVVGLEAGGCEGGTPA